MLHDAPPEPWLSFLNALDVGIDEPVDLHCMGGFAVVQAYGLERATADIDVLSVVPYSSGERLMALAGKESPLRRRHKVYLDVVSVATAPENYVDRLVPLCSCCWKRLKLFVLEAHDTSLTVPAYRGSPANRSSPIHCLSEVEKCVLHSDPNQSLNWKLDFAGFNSVYPSRPKITQSVTVQPRPHLA